MLDSVPGLRLSSCTSVCPAHGRRTRRDVRALRLAVALLVITSLFPGAQSFVFAADEKATESVPAAADPEAIKFFENKVRPVLVEHCYSCHAGEKHKGGLKVDSRDAIATGGDTGTALEPGRPDDSLLIQAIEYADPNLQMPPKKKLSDAQIADLRKWVELGAPWPAEKPVAKGQTNHRKSGEINDEDRQYWAFQPIKSPALPEVQTSGWTDHPIDRLVAGMLQTKGLQPNGPATPRELIRRVYFDLIGLPPTYEEVRKFEQDPSPAAFAQIVDDLLNRPQYGERWGRYWLDVVRFAQTNGYERDDEKPNAWRYRDYVIDAFNRDKPYNQFVTEQLAGDELPAATPEQLIATGFYRVGTWDDEPDDARMAEFDALDDVLVATGASFMGLTLGCARCHNHMLDPIPQADYYRLASVFRNLRQYEIPRQTLENGVLLPLVDRNQVAAWQTEQAGRLEPLQAKLKETKDAAERKKIEDEIRKIKEMPRPGVEWALAVKERGGKPIPTSILIRGNAGTPGAEVQPGVLSVLGGQNLEPQDPEGKSPTTGLRLALARWLTNPQNPLTARVMANRIWQHHFGEGIVRTTSDFGKGGLPPSNIPLLDWLSAEFIRNGWSIKSLHRTILTSRAYQMSSSAVNPEAMRVDPGNELFWRQNLHRLDAEALRDALLTVSGTLNPKSGGRGFFPSLSGEVLAGQSRPGGGWDISSPEEQNRRSIYAFVKRSMVVPFLETFDYSNVNQPLGERQVTTVAPQALFLLNDQFLQKQAAAFARRVSAGTSGGRPEQVITAYRIAFGRDPRPNELKLGLDYLSRLEHDFAAQSSRMTFRPEVPDSLHQSYLNKLKPELMLLGPTTGWSYARGLWAGGYEGIQSLVPERAPFALYQGARFADGTISMRLQLQPSLESAAILFRSQREGDLNSGYELLLDPKTQQMAVAKANGKELRRLGDAFAAMPPGVPFPLRIQLQGPKILVFQQGDAPVLEVTDPDYDPARSEGQLGFRVVGAALSVEHLVLQLNDRRIDVATAPVSAAGGTGEVILPKNWSVFGDRWRIAPEGGYQVDPDPGAKSVWDAISFADGTVEAELQLLAPGGDAGLCLRVTEPATGTDSLHAYNINLLPGRLRLGKHENNWRELTSAQAKIEVGQPVRVKAVLQGNRIQVFLNGETQPLIDFTDPEPLPAGKVGLRTFQSKFVCRSLQVQSGDKTLRETFAPPAPDKPEPEVATQKNQAEAKAAQQALEAYCLMLLNLNEMVYID